MLAGAISGHCKTNLSIAVVLKECRVMAEHVTILDKSEIALAMPIP